MAWRPIETAPLDKAIILWWTPIDDNKYAEVAVIGQVSFHEKGKWWNGQLGEYQDLERITHWMPLPKQPRNKERDNNRAG